MDARIIGADEVQEIVKRKFPPGAIGQTDDNGRTMLYVAAYLGDVGFIRKLLALGLKPAQPDKWGITALDIAVERGNLDAAAVLREGINGGMVTP